jgi:hypothetical protein
LFDPATFAFVVLTATTTDGKIVRRKRSATDVNAFTIRCFTTILADNDHQRTTIHNQALQPHRQRGTNVNFNRQLATNVSNVTRVNNVNISLRQVNNTMSTNVITWCSLGVETRKHVSQ